jgi:hypothetical protein
MAEMLLPDRRPMRIFPMWLQGWVSLCEKAVYSWLDDRAPTMGAAIAYSTVFSHHPCPRVDQVYGPAVDCAWHDEWNGLAAEERARLKARQGVSYPVLDNMMVVDPAGLAPVPGKIQKHMLRQRAKSGP